MEIYLKTILFVTHVNSLYGANRALLTQILQIRNDYDVLVLIPKKGEFSKELDKFKIPNLNYFFSSWGYNIYSIKSYIYAYAKYILTELNLFFIVNKLKSKSIDLIHTNSSVINIGAKIAKKLNKPHVWHIREFGVLDYDFKQGFLTNQYKYIFNNSSRMVFVSNSVFSEFLRHSRIFDHSKIYSKSLIMHDKIQDNSKNVNKDIKNENTSQVIKFVLVGLIQPNKNQILALKAVSYLVSELGITNFLLEIYGSGNNVYINELKDFVKDNYISNYVLFKGFDPQISFYLDRYDVGLTPSKSEAYGLVTIEYMKSGLPVIGLNSGGTRELIINDETGFLVDDYNYISFARKMSVLIDNKPLILEMGAKARLQFEKNFCLSNSSNKLINLYNKII